MPDILLIEDEKASIDNLTMQIKRIGGDFNIVGITDSVKKSIEWINQHPSPQLVISDIRLSDGLCFNIFENCKIPCPIIFVTAYDRYILNAFEYCSIDYILKPVSAQKLENAMEKFKSLKKYFLDNYENLQELVNPGYKKRSRIIVRKSGDFQIIKMENIAYFYTDRSLVFLVDRENKKSVVDVQNLSEIYDYLDHESFFRPNRQYIVSINYIKKYKKAGNNQLAIEMALPQPTEITVSQNNTSGFRKWVKD